MIWILCQLGAAAALLSCFRLRTRTQPELSRALFWSLPFGAAGAYALGFVYRLPGYFRGEIDPFGAAAWGALFGIALAFAWQLRRGGRPVAASLDELAPYLLLCLAIGRLGCFAAGCDAGRVTDLAWAVRFAPSTATFHDHVTRGLVLAGDRGSLAVHPTQLYESAAALAIALAIWASRAERRLAPGTTLALAAIGYASARSLIELCRENALASPALWTSLAVLLVGALWLVRQRQPAAHNGFLGHPTRYNCRAKTSHAAAHALFGGRHSSETSSSTTHS